MIFQQRFKTLNLITLDTEALLANVELVRKLSGDKVIPVLKSNAYGHGIKLIAKTLNDSDCEIIAVDSYYEANQILRTFRGRILVLGHIDPRNFRLLNTKKVSFVVHDLETLRTLARRRKPLRIHLELNTGMNRLGISGSDLDETLALFQKHENIRLEGIMSHLADADNPKDTSVVPQVATFDKLTRKILDAGLRPEFIHIAATAGSLKVKSRYANSLRFGLGLYGINPLKKGDKYFEKFKKLQPVLELKSTIIQTIDLRRGEKVGYNGTFTAKKKMKIAILPLGYHEAIPRELSSRGILTYPKGNLPIVGRICMNHTTIDITNTDLQVGDEVTVISSTKSAPNSLINLESNHNIYPHELLARLCIVMRRQIKK
ncbi:alanine racemase [Candidatus Saccharibacteria bacterium]|nr:alanine racemase [Candidatus Saccharibacteria bacterium]